MKQGFYERLTAYIIENQDKFYRLAYSYVKNQDDALDAVQNAVGTEEEWAQHDVKIKVWYEVKSQTDRYLSLAVMGNNNWNNSGYEARYYNFDIEAGRWVTICDILDDAHIQLAEESIRKQMKQREKETGMEFWGDERQGIDKKTKFYMNSEGNPVIVFGEYEIAPGAAGVQEFEVSTQMR